MSTLNQAAYETYVAAMLLVTSARPVGKNPFEVDAKFVLEQRGGMDSKFLTDLNSHIIQM